MFVFDTIALAPIRGVTWLAQKIIEAAEQELTEEENKIRQALNDLYRQLETEQITEAIFDEYEAQLLDRLDQIEALKGDGNDEAE